MTCNTQNTTFPEQERKALLNELFAHLDAAAMGDEVRQALASGDEKRLVSATARHFRTRSARHVSYNSNFSYNSSPETAARAVKGDVTVINIPWQFPDGRIDWLADPTSQLGFRNNEWLWQLNRMWFWIDMGLAYKETGDEKYAKAFNEQLLRWLAIAGAPPEDQWNVAGGVWRTIETGLRMMFSWTIAFESFRSSPSFTDESICMMLGSMVRHAKHLRQHHSPHTNWLLMEMSGLYTWGVFFPEFSCASEMRQYAILTFENAIKDQILPDGMHDELSPDYQSVMLGCAFAFLNIAKNEDCLKELPPDFLPVLEHTFGAILDMATPCLTSPKTNDTHTFHIQSHMQKAFAYFPHRLDFQWAATSREKGHEPPSDPTASRCLPWGGFAVMRSDWSADALYCCFDVGPLGVAHRHEDKLNINIYKGDEELIFDDGGGQYEKSPYRVYATSAADHNTCLVDGMLQSRTKPLKASEPIDMHWISNESFDYACSIYDGEFAPPIHRTEELATLQRSTPATHQREVRFFKPEFFCDADTLRSRDGKPHDYELRFHLDTLKLEPFTDIPGAWISDFGRKHDVLIVPLWTEGLECQVIQGKDDPPMGGWFVGRNDLTRHKCSTLAMAVKTQKDHRFCTLFIPVQRNGIMPVLRRRSEKLFELTVNGRIFIIQPDDLNR